MKNSYIFIASTLLSNTLCPNEDGSGYVGTGSSSRSYRSRELDIPPKLQPFIENAKNALSRKTGALSAFKHCIQCPLGRYDKQDWRYYHFAGVVIERWQDLHDGAKFLKPVFKEARKLGQYRSVSEQSLPKPLECLLRAPNFETFESRLKKYIALFNLLKEVKVDFYDDAQVNMKRHILQQVEVDNFFLFNNAREHYKALTLLFKGIGLTDEEVSAGGLTTAPIDLKIARKLTQAENCIIKDDTIGTTTLIKAHSCLPFKILDNTGYNLLSTALNIHAIKDRSFYIWTLLDKGCNLREEDLKYTVRDICNRTMQAENDVLANEKIQALAKLYHLLAPSPFFHRYTSLQKIIQNEVREFEQAFLQTKECDLRKSFSIPETVDIRFHDLLSLREAVDID